MKFPVLFVLLAGLSTLGTAAIPLRLERFDGPAPEFSDADGTVSIRGPMVVRADPASIPTATDQVLDLEYFCIGGLPAFTASPGPPFDVESARNLPEMSHSETWTRYTARLATDGQPLPAGWRQLCFGFPLPDDRQLQIRKATLRAEIPGEFDAVTTRSAASAAEDTLEAYLAQSFPAAVAAVSVGEKDILIEGTVGKENGPLLLADIPMDVVLDDPRSWQTVVDLAPDPEGQFSLRLPRLRQRDGLDYDRLTSRWQIVRKRPGGFESVSHARYAGSVYCRSPELPAARPKNKKGLGGWGTERLPDELEELGISAVTVNLMVQQLISPTPATGTVPIRWQGRTYHVHEDRLAGFDATFLKAQQHGAMVSVILLLGNPATSDDATVRMMGHPDATKEGIFAMPYVTSAEGIGMYGAILNCMAERWSRPDSKHGRVHHWIIHNEVDAGWVWTNAGEKTAITYLDLYQRSMRLTDLIARQYDPNSRPFISLTHFWAGAGDRRWYGSKRLIGLLVDFTRAEGDFPWALAYHPYPQDLFNPRTWEDPQAKFELESPLITPKNLEVLDAYMKQPALLHQGKVRPVHLSENGFNSRDYSEKSLEDQAAGMALAWKKIQRLSAIESWQYHNWIDNRGEGGLRIGLRKFPDEPGDPLGKKPIWFLYQGLGTPREDALAAPYLKTIGIGSWEEIHHSEPIR